jgi:predicted nucleic acid-binding protein
VGEAPGGAATARRLPPDLSAPLIVLDTDVVVTALIGREDASSYLVCRAVGTGDVRLATSDRFLYELVGVVRRKTAQGLIGDPARAFEIALDVGFHAEHHSFEPLP